MTAPALPQLIDPPAVPTTGIMSDNVDDRIRANRDAIVVANQHITSLDARLKVVESRPSAPGTPGAITRIPIPAALEAAIEAVPVNGVIVFEGPTSDFVAERR